MIPYGKKKHRHKIHPHNECDICGSDWASKIYARQECKKIIAKELYELENEEEWDEYDDIWFMDRDEQANWQWQKFCMWLDLEEEVA